jgi:hypothetical protein
VEAPARSALAAELQGAVGKDSTAPRTSLFEALPSNTESEPTVVSQSLLDRLVGPHDSLFDGGRVSRSLA